MAINVSTTTGKQAQILSPSSYDCTEIQCTHNRSLEDGEYVPCIDQIVKQIQSSAAYGL